MTTTFSTIDQLGTLLTDDQLDLTTGGVFVVDDLAALGVIFLGGVAIGFIGAVLMS